ncbi:helix-turn-helix domain-containing protein [Glycomyces algeriensis]|uniref:helix-turn-helix domain-containing protein n=1 Tax=Glycomyces algeriensis TaxID=256037 RepID=UPI0035A3828F
MSFTEQGMGKLLRCMGFSFRLPDKRAIEADPEAMREWVEVTSGVARAGSFRGRGHPVRRPGRGPLRPAVRSDLGPQRPDSDHGADREPVRAQRDVDYLDQG